MDFIARKIDGEMYVSLDQVNKAIEEKNAEIENIKATHYAEMVDAGMRERKLKRALWRAIALFCARSCEYFSGIMSHCLMGQDDLYKKCEEKKNKYLNAMYKCRAKAYNYK
jgi:tRNA isopentenyl-2-thiomethyl-A-37 hydroxylase MiaE